jgi:uncharacterized membrane protein
VPASSRRATVRDAAALGVVSGMRTFTAAGVLALRGRWDGPAGRIAPLVALGEFAADKHPAIPPRSDPPLLLGRVLSGAIAGRALAGARGAGVGAAGAAATTHASERLRGMIGQRTGIPDALIGLAEDVVAVGLAVHATRAVDRNRG